MTNKQWKLNAHFYKDFEFWIALVVMVAAGSTIIHETVSNLYFWLDIAMILLGIVTLVDSMILHRKQIKN
ncbi:hypothetical protein [Secundilactobacillus mixtipabuli]|uniref:Uncharacterized protein n=1 Tax=Secundilactobacillus mixtipabuli TaxID=1435342 RepID=A0A1Z5IBE4_9LACO|nr:hypothetical protein [Secundilactobacillus mixtipabuli]GAW99062.1 hypothetical protein IWT30_01022 [Secundilactobacillus mixtipabuli]